MKFKDQQSQKGQTLIETLVAAFILTMGIAAAIGLATYSLNATTTIRQQTVALGLAREGLEVVKNMRDTNWLRGGAISTGCYNFYVGDSTGYCYPNWLTAQYNISGSGAGTTYYIAFDKNANPPWSLVQSSNFGLNFDATGGTTGAFYNPGGAATTTNSGYGRRITITQETFAPFNQSTGPRLKVVSEVWWRDKKCPMTDTPGATTACKVALSTYLTNWRTF